MTDLTPEQELLARLHWIRKTYYQPDPTVVSQREQNGQRISYVGHAHITNILLDIDPLWSWEPLEIRDGRPVTHLHNGQIHRRDRDPIEKPTVTLWGKLTIFGVSRIAVGSVDADKPELDKELVSSLIVNGAMRFGIALALWTGEDPTVVTQLPSRPSQTAPERPQADNTPQTGHSATPATEPQERALYAISKKLDKLPPAKGSLTKVEAGKMIEKLQAELDAANAEEVF